MAAGSMLALKFTPFKKAAYTGAVVMAVGVLAESVALYCIHSRLLYVIFSIVWLWGLGLIFSAART